MGWEEVLEDAKKRHRPRLKNWSRDGFASKRAADFEALRARNWAEDPTCRCRIATERAADLTPAAFVEKYENTYTPVLISGCFDEQRWAARERWSMQRLKEDFRDRRFKCGEDDDGRTIRVTMRNFTKYVEHQVDDSPLYIFDSTYDDDHEAKRILQDYSVPKYFPTNPDQEPHWAFGNDNGGAAATKSSSSSSSSSSSPGSSSPSRKSSAPSPSKSSSLAPSAASESGAANANAAVAVERGRSGGSPQSSGGQGSGVEAGHGAVSGGGVSPMDQDAQKPLTACTSASAAHEAADKDKNAGGGGGGGGSGGGDAKVAAAAGAINKGVGYHDLFSLVGERRRPPYRWILVGPRRSGTCVHTDPLASSAWNSVVAGRKLWVIFPPGTPKSVVKCKKVMQAGEDDEAINYFVDHIPRLKKLHPQLRVYQFVQGPGDTVFIPGGWWHAVLNLDDSIGVTQNYCSKANFDPVWRETRGGRKKMAVKWLSKLHEEHPDLAARAEQLNAEDGFTMYQSTKDKGGKEGKGDDSEEGEGEDSGGSGQKKKDKKHKKSSSKKSSSSSSSSDASGKPKKPPLQRGDGEARYGPEGGRSRQSALVEQETGKAKAGPPVPSSVDDLLKLAFPPAIAAAAAAACKEPMVDDDDDDDDDDDEGVGGDSSGSGSGSSGSGSGSGGRSSSQNKRRLSGAGSCDSPGRHKISSSKKSQHAAANSSPRGAQQGAAGVGAVVGALAHLSTCNGTGQ